MPFLQRCASRARRQKNWQVLLKTTALVSIIGLTDMVRVAEEAAKAKRDADKAALAKVPEMQVKIDTLMVLIAETNFFEESDVTFRLDEALMEAGLARDQAGMESEGEEEA